MVQRREGGRREKEEEEDWGQRNCSKEEVAQGREWWEGEGVSETWFLAGQGWINLQVEGGAPPTVVLITWFRQTNLLGDFPDLSGLLNQHSLQQCFYVLLLFLFLSRSLSPSLRLYLSASPSSHCPSLFTLISRHFYWSAGFAAEIPVSVWRKVFTSLSGVL